MKKDDCLKTKELVRRAQGGDRSSCNLLLQQYSDKIKQMIVFHVNDKSMVHDLSQEVFLKIYRYLPHFKQESQFPTWLYRITQNTIKNYYRSMSPFLDSESFLSYQQEQRGNQNPESMMMCMELNYLLETALVSLPEELRLCYDLHVLEGQSYEDISRIMDCPIGTVRSRIHRARKLLQAAVDNLSS